MIDYIVLGLVQKETLTGYDIKKWIESSIGTFYKSSYGNLYPALKKLTENKFVTMDEQLQGARVKKYYRTTELGKKAFIEWLSLPFDFGMGAPALLAKIYFFGQLPEKVRNRRLQEYEMHYRQSLQQLRTMENSLSSADVEVDYFMQSTLYFGIRNTQTAIEWFEHIRGQMPLSEFVHREGE